MIEILDETGRAPAIPELRTALEALLAELGSEEFGATVAILPDAAVATRNLEDRGVMGATDVLSYPTWEPQDGADVPRVPHLGDVLIALGVAERQAQRAGHPVREELAILAAHGLMHLLGHDHESEDDWRPFHRAQARAALLLQRTVAAES